ncbi:MAG: UbiX family flavin prenyltransferase [Marinilabiliaceae bacterium]|jgi:4-hydroxy-3-polyprenylbenzoate decarboxylase|nr:UbiX family flavin prenyltransferase [Marinilabiliaceae bacterium]
MAKRKIIVAVTGASGAIYANSLLKKLEDIKDQLEEVAVVFSGNAEDIWEHELGSPPLPLSPSPSVFKNYSNNNLYAPFASGSARYDTMIICPSSMGMLGRVAHGVSDDLITRAADVMLKERRKLIFVPRETPYSLIHINNMKLLTEAGAVICPATPSFYSSPQTIDDLVLTVVDRVMDLAGFEIKTRRWGDAIE